MSLQKSRLRSFWPIPGTPYIFCEFYRPSPPGNMAFPTRYTNLIIHIEEGRCLLRVDWHNLNADHNKHLHSSRQTENKGILLQKNKLSLIYEQIFRYDSFDFHRSTSRQAKEHATFKKKKDLWKIDLDGDICKIDNIPNYFIHNQSSYRCLNFEHLITLSASQLLQFELEGNSLRECGGWMNIGDTLMQLCSIPNQGFLFSDTRHEQVIFLMPDSPRILSYNIRSIFADLPAPPRDTPVWDQMQSVSWQLIPLSTQSENSFLAYFQIPGFPIFEIHLDQALRGDIRDVFSFVGYCSCGRPFLSMNQNRTLFFCQSLIRRSNDLNTQVPIFTVDKQSSGWPADPHFVLQPQPFPLPPSIHRVCEMPLDDEYLLAFGHDRFWCIRADGEVIRPIYPRKSRIRRYSS